MGALPRDTIMPNETEAEVLPKLSLKGLKAQPGKGTVKEGDKYDIATLYGAANRAEVVNTTFGDSVKFSGSFKGRNLLTGKTYRSNKAYLPGVIEDMLAEAVAESEGEVEFAFVIGVEYSEKGNTGYAYTVRPLTKIKESDKLAALESLIEKELKALPAPATKDEKGKPKK